jgi:hypothetical protein
VQTVKILLTPTAVAAYPASPFGARHTVFAVHSIEQQSIEQRQRLAGFLAPRQENPKRNPFVLLDMEELRNG